MAGTKVDDNFFNEDNFEYAMIVGKPKDGPPVAAIRGNPDVFQTLGMAKYLYDITQVRADDETDKDKNTDRDDW